MVNIVEALGKSGRIGEAIEAARRIGDPDLRAQAMIGLVAMLETAGLPERLPQVAKEAVEAARQIKDAGYRARMTINVVEVLTKAGRTDEAVEAARRIEDAVYRSQAMAIVADAMLRNREADKARSALNEAQDAAEQAGRGAGKSTRLAAVAIGLAKLHHYRLARQAANLCTSPSDKLGAYTAIFREYLIERNPKLGNLFEEKSRE
jgi:hypothetical protein